MITALLDSLVAAIRSGDADAVGAALAAQPQLAVTADAEGMTPAHWAVAAAQPDILSVLLTLDAPLEAVQASHGRTPLHLAALKGNPKLIRLLLEAGANAFAEDAQGKRPLDLATTPTAVTVLRPPTLAPADAFRQAIAAGAVLRAGRLLAAQPALRSVTDAGGRTPLHWAVDAGATAMVAALLAGGMPVSRQDVNGCTPLYEAARRGNVDLVRLLLAAGATPDVADYQSITPLHLAAAHGDAERTLIPPSPTGLAQPALTHGVEAAVGQCAFDFDDASPAEPSAVTAGDQRDDLAIAEMLCAAGAMVNTRARGGITPLHFAADHGDAALVSLLLAYGADVDPLLTLWHATPLHIAAARGQQHLFPLLLQAGADPNLRDAYDRGCRDLLMLAGA